LVSCRLARERQLLHPLMQAVWHHRNFQMIAKSGRSAEPIAWSLDMVRRIIR
jgi:hypothetical protein